MALRCSYRALHVATTLVTAAALATAACAGPAIASDPAVSIQGSTVFNHRLIEPHRQDIERLSGQVLSVVPSKSIHGLMALISGRIEVAMISTSLAAEVAYLHQKDPALPLDRLVGHEITRTRVGFARHVDNPVQKLALAQIRAILLGEITSWRDVGGPDLQIAVVTVQPGGGVPSTVRGRLLDGRKFEPRRLIEVEAASHVVKITAQEPGALGIAQLALLSQPGVAEIATDLPVEQQLMLVTLGEPPPRIRSVIEAMRHIAKASQ